MLGLHFADGGRTAAFVVLGLSMIVFFVVVGASGDLRSSRRRRFRTAYPFGRPYWNQDFDLADPARQLHAVMAGENGAGTGILPASRTIRSSRREKHRLGPPPRNHEASEREKTPAGAFHQAITAQV